MSMVRRPDTAFAPKLHWADRLSEERPGTISKPCSECANPMWLPASKLKRSFCSRACQNASREARRAERLQACEGCGVVFLPDAGNQARGGGRFCSQKCNSAGLAALNTPEVRARAVAGRKKAQDEGRVPSQAGSLNPRWQGGKSAYLARQRDTGKAAAALRRYRAANPEKVKEFSRRRASRKLGRLPYGTIPRIRDWQSNRCAICRARLKAGWHLDHVLPLARGGTHTPNNLQILCAPCNLAKSSRDPIDHMQSLGRLL